MTKPLPPTYLFWALLAIAALHFLVPINEYLSFPLTLVGLLPLALGSVLTVSADRSFKRHQTTIKPFERSSALVTSFPFSISRNPMYLGLTFLLLGVALIVGSLSSLIPVLIFPWLMTILFIRREESMLAETFGNEWDEYRSRVRRWI